MVHFRKNYDSVSPVVAVILMIAITIVLAWVLYEWGGCGCPAEVDIKYERQDNATYLKVWAVSGYEHKKGPEIRLDEVEVSIKHNNQTIIKGPVASPDLLIILSNTTINDIYEYRKNRTNAYMDVDDEICVKDFDFNGDGKKEKILLNWGSVPFLEKGFEGWSIKFKVDMNIKKEPFEEDKWGAVFIHDGHSLFDVDIMAHRVNDNQTAVNINLRVDDWFNWSDINIRKYNYPPEKDEFMNCTIIYPNGNMTSDSDNFWSKGEKVELIVYDKGNYTAGDYPFLIIFYNGQAICEEYLGYFA